MSNRERGFGLIELMIVVGIIAIIAMLALPRFQQFQAKARMGEAKNNLSHIFTLQHSYHSSKDEFISFARYGRLADGSLNCTPSAGAKLIGFQLNPCSATADSPVPRYGYLATADRLNFLASASSGSGDGNLVCPGSRFHSFSVNQLKEFKESPDNNALGACF